MGENHEQMATQKMGGEFADRHRVKDKAEKVWGREQLEKCREKLRLQRDEDSKIRRGAERGRLLRQSGGEEEGFGARADRAEWCWWQGEQRENHSREDTWGSGVPEIGVRGL